MADDAAAPPGAAGGAPGDGPPDLPADADAEDVQHPDDGVGPLFRRRYVARVRMPGP